MITTLLVEDDPLFIESIRDMLLDIGANIQLLDTCSTLRQAREAILKYNPQLLLLDVELPDGNSLDLLNNLDEANQGIFEVIFITAFDQYALEAIKKDAADYLLKPFTKTELIKALQKVEKRLQIYERLERTEELEKRMKDFISHNQQANNILINTYDGALLLNANEIIHLEAESNYTIFHMENNKKITSSKTLSTYETTLESLNFFRVHRQSIINIAKIKSIINLNGSYSVLLSDGSKLEISRRKKKDFFEKIALKQ